MSLAQIHRVTASRTFGIVESNKGTTTGTTEPMGYVIWGVECDEDGSRLQADKAMGTTEIDQECHGRRGTTVPHRGSEEAFKLTYGEDELCTFKHYDTLLGNDT